MESDGGGKLDLGGVPGVTDQAAECGMTREQIQRGALISVEKAGDEVCPRVDPCQYVVELLSRWISPYGVHQGPRPPCEPAGLSNAPLCIDLGKLVQPVDHALAEVGSARGS